MGDKLLSKMKKVYLKKFCDADVFSVWIVDGKYVRMNIDEEFTNYGQHYRFNFIPKNEFWIDKESGKGEEKYYIDSMLLMYRLMAKGISHEEAVRRSDVADRRERAKGLLLVKDAVGKLPREDLLKSVKVRQIKKYSNEKVKTWIVDGELVRDLFFLNFVEGGHGYVYPFIPKDEVWIEESIDSRELKYILLHELHERNLMAKGWCYDIDTPEYLKTGTIKKGAHPDSSRIEFFCRHHPGKVDGEIKKELKLEM
jgi:hypothetical protein